MINVYNKEIQVLRRGDFCWLGGEDGWRKKMNSKISFSCRLIRNLYFILFSFYLYLFSFHFLSFLLSLAISSCFHHPSLSFLLILILNEHVFAFPSTLLYLPSTHSLSSILVVIEVGCVTSVSFLLLFPCLPSLRLRAHSKAFLTSSH